MINYVSLLISHLIITFNPVSDKTNKNLFYLGLYFIVFCRENNNVTTA